MNFLVEQQPAYAYTGGKPFDAAKPSIVFIHGAANDHSVWTFQARYFAHHGFNALAVDLPGHGRTFADAKTTIAAYSDWIVNLLDNGGIVKATMVGHSMGTLIALDAAARYPARVDKLGLLGTSVPMPVADALLDAAKHRPSEAFDMLNLWGHAPQMRIGASSIPGTSLTMSYRRLLERSRPGVLAKDLAACRAFSPGESTLESITAPTLILSGTRDMMTPPKASAAVANAITGARLVSLEMVGHAMMQEAPGRVVDELAAFLKP